MPETDTAATKPDIVITSGVGQVAEQYKRLSLRFCAWPVQRHQIPMSAVSPVTGNTNTVTAEPRVILPQVPIRLVFGSSKCDHITPLLRQLHWLKVVRRMDFKLAVLVYKCLHGLASSYTVLHTESEFRKRLRSASSHELSVPRTRLSTYGDRAFPVAAVRIWNSLPQHITSAPSLPVFCTRLKTYFLELCYP